MNSLAQRTLFLFAILLGLTLTVAPQAQPYALPADVVGAGATEASGGAYTLRGTVGQAADGRATGGAYALGEGFWPAATSATPSGPAVTFILTPTNPAPPVSVPRGGSFTFDATTILAPGAPTQLDYWARARLPNGNLYGPTIFGPVTLNLPMGGGTAPVTQTVPNAAPLGTYWYIMRVGTFPSTVVATDSFQVTVTPAAAQNPDGLAAGATEPKARQAASDHVALGGAASRVDEAWPAFTAGVLLKPGTVLELRDGILLVAETEDAKLGDEEAEGVESEAPETVASQTDDLLPESFALHAAYPNPFATATTLHLDLPEAAEVRLVVYDVLGRAVAVLHDGPMKAGSYRTTLRAAGLPSGTYLARLTTEGGFAQTQRLTILR